MTETSAKIIDFSVYKTNKRAESELLRGDVYSTAAYGALAFFYFFWPLLAWPPFGLLDRTASRQDRS